MAMKWNIHALLLLLSFFKIHSEFTVESVCIEAKYLPGGIPTKDGSSENTRVCDVSGGSGQNISTFDSVKYEYHGTCSYTLLKSCNDGLMNNFTIIGRFEGNIQSESNIRELRISDPELQKDEITLEGYNVADFKEILQTNYSRFACYYEDAVVLDLSHGIKVYWGNKSHIVIEVPESTEGLCGLCGNNNGIKYDDLSTKDGNLVTNIVTFGDSWRTDDDCPVCSNCEDDTLCEINPENEDEAEKMCAVFDGAPTCGEHTNETLSAECKNILCAINQTDPQVQVCPLIEPYLEACEDTGVDMRLHLNDLCGKGCHVAQELIPYGESWMNQDCSESCTCEEATGLNCTTTQCDEFATCISKDDGSASCECNTYYGDGLTCSVKGVWSSWGPWSSCTKTCGHGKRTRDRTCLGGGPCDGPPQSSEQCNTHHCKNPN